MKRVKIYLDENKVCNFNRNSRNPNSTTNHVCDCSGDVKTNKLNMRDSYNFHLKKLRVKWMKQNDVLMIAIGALAAVIGFLFGKYF